MAVYVKASAVKNDKISESGMAKTGFTPQGMRHNNAFKHFSLFVFSRNVYRYFEIIMPVGGCRIRKLGKHRKDCHHHVWCYAIFIQKRFDRRCTASRPSALASFYGDNGGVDGGDWRGHATNWQRIIDGGMAPPDGRPPPFE